ncbi:MAG: hypothetical protein JXD21_00070 [Candidatus Omnitrophica bacterium]|nr:hypothetical protein [Candidatus Omnitrophota bacterium]
MDQEQRKQNLSILALLTLIPIGIFVLVMFGSRQDFNNPPGEEDRIYQGTAEGENPIQTPLVFIPGAPQKIKAPETVMMFIRTDHEGIDARTFFSSLIKDRQSVPFLYRIHIDSPENDPQATLGKIERLPQGGYAMLIIEVILHYKNDRQEPLPQEIQKTEYSLWMQSLIKNAANDILKIAHYYKEKYPDIKLLATSIGLGADVLIDAIDRDLPGLEKIFIWYPTLATIRDKEFIWTLRWGKYDKEKVTVISLVNDPNNQELLELNKNYQDIFQLSIIKPHPRPQVKQRNPAPLVPSKPNI